MGIRLLLQNLLNSVFQRCMVFVLIQSLIHLFVYVRRLLQAGDAMMNMTGMVPELKELEVHWRMLAIRKVK